MRKYFVLMMIGILVSPVFAAELLLHYDFEGDTGAAVTDKSGSGIDAQIYETASLSASGHSGQCIEFSPNAGLIQDNLYGYLKTETFPFVPNPDLEGINGEGMTFTAWVKRYSNPADPNSYVAPLGSSTYYTESLFSWMGFSQFFFEKSSHTSGHIIDELQCNVFLNTGTSTAANMTSEILTTADGKWHFVVWRMSDTLGSYIQRDRDYAEYPADTGWPGTDLLPVLQGYFTFAERNRKDYHAFFTGQMDDIKVYIGALTKEELLEMYKLGRKAMNPVPADTATGLIPSLTTTVSWTMPDPYVLNDVLTSDVYFGQMPDLSDATVLLSGSTATSVAISVEPEKTYYWRVDVHDPAIPATTLTGNIWSFQTQLSKATNPVPADGSTGVSIELPEVSWYAAYGADSYKIYLSDDYSAVANRTVPSITRTLTSVNLPLDSPAPANFDLNTTYYWAVDSIAGAVTTPGDVWSAATTGFYRWENMDYADVNDLQTVWSGDIQQPDYVTGYMKLPYNSQTAAYTRLVGIDSRGLDLSSAWMMRYSYYFINDNPEVTTSPAVEFQLLDGSDQVVYSTTVPGFVTSNTNVDVSLYAVLANLTNVRKFKVIVPGYTDTTGSVMIDRFVFGTVQCWPDENKAADMNQDCKVDLEDFSMIAAEWMDCGLFPSGACD